MSWIDDLARQCREAKRGDVIDVDSSAKADLAERALARLGKAGFGITVRVHFDSTTGEGNTLGRGRMPDGVLRSGQGAERWGDKKPCPIG